MKKLILSLSFILSIVISSYSQLFNVGIKAGYNSSLSINDLSYNSQDFKDDFFGNTHFGVFARLNFGKVYVQPEVLYTLQTKNYTVDIASQNSDITYDYKMRAIDIPLLLGYKVIDFKLINIRAFAGPKFRFDTNSSLKLKDFSGGVTADRVAQEVKSAKMGLEAGLGVDVLMLTFDVRYNLIGNLAEAKWSELGSSIKGIPSSTFLFTLGWKIL